jgi:MFS family permease
MGTMRNPEDSSGDALSHILTRDFVLAFLTLFAFILAHYMLTPTLPIYLERLGAKEVEIGVLVGAFGVSSLFLRLVVGQALLSYSERSIMMIGAAVFAASFFGCIVLPLFWPLFLVRLFQGLAFACLDTAVLAFVVRIVPPTYAGQGISYCLLAVNLSLALSPIVGMFFVNRYTFTLLFLVGAGLSLAALFLSSLVKGPRVREVGEGPPKEGFAVNTRVIPTAVSCFFHNLIWGSLLAFIPLYALKRGVNNPAPFFSAIAAVTIACRLFGGRFLDTWDKEKIVSLFMASSVVVCVALAFAKGLAFFVAIGILWGVGAAFLFPGLMALAMNRAGSSSGTAVGTFRALGDSGLALGPMIMGTIISYTSYPTMFLCLGFASFMNLTYFHFFVREGRRQ